MAAGQTAVQAQAAPSYGPSSYGAYSYGPSSCGACSYGPYSYGHGTNIRPTQAASRARTTRVQALVWGLYTGSISASPPECPLRGHGRAGTQNGRLFEY